MRTRSVLGFLLIASAMATWGFSSYSPSLAARARALLSRASQQASRSEVRMQAAREVFEEVGVVNDAGEVVVALEADEVGDGAVVWASRAGEPKGVLLVSDQNAGQVAVFNTAGQPRFILDGNLGLISAAGDMAEVFPAAGAIAAGSVLVIDPARPGALQVASRPYDRRVAGVVSGANGYRPGITLGAGADQRSTVPLTLTGTVYCLASNVNGSIRAGDLLTTSAIPGHAMRATDPEAFRGAVLGKALEDLRTDRGLIMVLASLQ